jgi:predicted molibdopterin-dependent oxidoreductase YjgC
VEAVWGRPVPKSPGRTLPHMWDAIRAGELRGLMIFGEDVAQTDPEAVKVREALGSLELLVVQELFLSETARLAHVVLPAASVYEKDGTFTNGERRIQRVRKVVPAPGEARADWEILCALMTATGWAQGYADPGEIMDEIARVIPAFAGVGYARLEGDGLQWPVPATDHPGTPMLHTESFPIGRARFARVEFVPSPELGGALTLVTGRVLEHYNAGTMTRRTPNVELVDREWLEIHPADAARRGIADGGAVRLTSRHGEVRAVARLTDRVPPGTLFTTFHFPESRTNDLIGPTRDRTCDCPEYKVTGVEVERVNH